MTWRSVYKQAAKRQAAAEHRQRREEARLKRDKKRHSCPFCGSHRWSLVGRETGGGEDSYKAVVEHFVVACHNPQCLADGPRGDTPQEALDAWKRRRL